MIQQEYLQFHIKVGRNKEENDQLLTMSGGDDMWVHLSDFPSGHAVISNPNDEKISRKVLKRACCLVKQYSKYSAHKKISFDITKIKYLEKTKHKGEVRVLQIIKNLII